MKLVIDDKIPFIHEAASRFGECIFLPGAAITATDVHDADVLIVRTRTRVDRTLLDGSKVQLVVTATIGHDHIDKNYLAERRIAWSNCPGCNATSVAQYVRNSLWIAAAAGHFDFLLPHAPAVFPLPDSSKHNVVPSESTIPPSQRIYATLRGLTVGIVGVGNVGSAVVAALEAEGCKVLRCDPPKNEPYRLSQLAERADVITFHTPLTYGGEHPTYHLANKAFFDSLRRCKVFINAARGECVDTTAIRQALAEGRIHCAIVDTWENEPDISLPLLRQALIATPHIAGYSADGKANGTRMSLEAVAHHFSLPDHQFDVQPPALPAGFAYGTLPTAWAKRLPLTALEQLRRYNPLTDSEQLKAHPESFEKQRGNYPLRRE